MGAGNNSMSQGNLSPGAVANFGVSNDRLPVGTIPLFATSSPEYETSVNKVIAAANQVYYDFVRSEEGYGFCGQICLVGDSVGSILAYDALCRDTSLKRASSDNSVGGNATNCGTSEIGSSECSGRSCEGLDPENSRSQSEADRQNQHHSQQRHRSPDGKGIYNISFMRKMVLD